MPDLAYCIEAIEDKGEIEYFLQQDSKLHTYEIGDLEPFFWPKTKWWAARHQGKIAAMALRYQAPTLPALLLLERNNLQAATQLLHHVADEIPEGFYAHLSPGLTTTISHRLHESRGNYTKMSLQTLRPTSSEQFQSIALGPEHREELLSLYARSYPQNWFDPSMLATGQYRGVCHQERLVAVAGVHVYSPTYRVAAIGNITTAPEMRGQGLGSLVSSQLCQSLLSKVDTISLNVSSSNQRAIQMYEHLGFVSVASYEEWHVAPSHMGNAGPR